MPRYDYGCGEGHIEERLESRDASSVPCSECGRPASRLITTAPLVNGVAVPPMKERDIPLTRFMNALDEQQTAHRKAGLPPPDILGDAQKAAAAIAKHEPELITGT